MDAMEDVIDLKWFVTLIVLTGLLIALTVTTILVTIGYCWIRRKHRLQKRRHNNIITQDNSAYYNPFAIARETFSAQNGIVISHQPNLPDLPDLPDLPEDPASTTNIRGNATYAQIELTL